VDKNISQASDTFPRNSGSSVSQLVANPLRRLADQLKITNDRVLDDCPRVKRISAGLGVVLDPADAVEDMLQV